MSRRLPVLALAAATAVAGWIAPSPAGAAEFRSIAQPSAMYDAPSRQARRLFAAPRGMPVEVVSTLGQWVKVRDVAGDVLWVERTDLGERRSVVTTALVAVRTQPQDAASAALQADRGVLLDLAEPPTDPAAPGWLRVRHRDGTAGWVRLADVWGWQ